MKRILFLTLSLVFAISTFGESRAEKLRKQLLNRNTTSVIVASHRGDWRNFPENSIAALNSAVAMGVDIVELDLQMTKDSVIILMHDPTLDRTTTGKGIIAETNYDDIKKLKLKNGCAIRTIHNIPTLEEALVAAKGKVLVNLDKADRYFDKVYAIAKKTGTEKQIVMKGTKPAKDVKALYGEYLDELTYMPIVNLDKKNAEQEIENCLKLIKPCAFELLFVKDSNPLPIKMPKILNEKSLIWYNTLWDTMAGGHDDDASLTDVNNGWGYLVDKLNARIIQTDRPQMLINYLRSRNLHD